MESRWFLSGSEFFASRRLTSFGLVNHAFYQELILKLRSDGTKRNIQAIFFLCWRHDHTDACIK